MTLPNTMTEIPFRLFSSCSNLPSITIPTSIKTIGNEAFLHCENLESVSIPNSVTFIDSHAFEYCKKLKSVVIPEGIEEIRASTFAYCSDLTTVTLPNTLKAIRTFAFYGCNSVTTVTAHMVVPFSSISTKGDRGFFPNPSNAALYVPVGCVEVYSKAYLWGTFKEILEITTPPASGSFTVGDLKYAKMSNSTVLVAAANTEISGDVQIPAMVRDDVMYNVTIITENAFADCSAIRSITIPNSITAIGNGAFYGCTGLRRITMNSKDPISISESVFTGVDKRQCMLCVPEGSGEKYKSAPVWKDFLFVVEDDRMVVNDLSYALNGNGTVSVIAANQSAIGRYEIPSVVVIGGLEYTVTAVGANAFNGCTGLTAVTIPQTIIEIGNSAFAGCTNLMEIYCLGSTPIDLSNAFAPAFISHRSSSGYQFDGVDLENCILYVPTGSAELYRNAEGWKEFKHIVEMSSGVNNISIFPYSEKSIFTLSGQRLMAPQKGINIIGGKKVVVK